MSTFNCFTACTAGRHSPARPQASMKDMICALVCLSPMTAAKPCHTASSSCCDADDGSSVMVWHSAKYRNACDCGKGFWVSI